MNLRNKWLLLLFTLSAYMVLYYVYDTPGRSIYINGASLLGRDSMIEQCMIDMVRYVYGYLGIVMMLVGIDLSVHHYMPSVYKWEWLLWLGKNTLGIYIVNHYMNECLLRIDFTSNYFYSLTAVETILMLCAHSAIIVLLRKNNWSRRLLLGE